MCDALKELMKDELDAARQSGLQEGQERGLERGLERGQERGQERVNILAARLIQLNRINDFLRSTTDKEYQEQLFQEFGL